VHHRRALQLSKEFLVILLHLIYDVRLRGPSDNKPLIVRRTRLGDDVEVYVVDDLNVRGSVKQCCPSSMRRAQTNLVCDAAVILGGVVSSAS
jgi:hypothetical protein